MAESRRKEGDRPAAQRLVRQPLPDPPPRYPPRDPHAHEPRDQPRASPLRLGHLDPVLSEDDREAVVLPDSSNGGCCGCVRFFPSLAREGRL